MTLVTFTATLFCSKCVYQLSPIPKLEYKTIEKKSQLCQSIVFNSDPSLKEQTTVKQERHTVCTVTIS